MRKQKKDDEQKNIEKMQNKALMRKVSKEREQEAILRFENQNKKFKCKMENLKIKEQKEEEERLKKLFRP